jgi:hypothetical protein
MKRVIALLFLVCAWAASPGARAQLGLPLPQVPVVGDVLDRTREGLANGVDPLRDSVRDTLRNARRLEAQDLLRTHPRELEADPAGQPIIRSQILALGMSDAAIAEAQRRGFEVVRTDAIDSATAMVTLRAPPGMSTRRALRALREADPHGVYDFDHLHQESGTAFVPLSFAQAASARAGPRIGLIDTGVGAAPGIVSQRAFASETPIPGAHGAAIAGMLSSAAPGARIYAADIYGGAPTGGASSALARALGWLATENTPVINVSLVGPRNRVVEAVVARTIARGIVIVAAVGNDGPAAAPLYPASYSGVIGVTGVDTRERVLIEAGRGAQVDFAALGVHGDARGTSYAAPIVAARLAMSNFNAVRSEARDLGARGRDDIYGYGLISTP